MLSEIPHYYAARREVEMAISNAVAGGVVRIVTICSGTQSIPFEERLSCL